ncbi:hypothetical protein [Duganella sp. BuS-21]|uniref:hypothetical protein n=1 Tax=Duganella sp. BuS-21 TaxID=2943848 RepID=UPI0035A57D00
MKSKLKFAMVPALIATMPIAHAGRPMVVDDAAIVAANSCQLETWVQKNRDSTEYWAVPACNFTGNLEAALGAARVKDGAGQYSLAVLQGKTVFKPLVTNGWGVGLVFGNQFKPGDSLSGDTYASVPVSFSFQDDRFLMHANVGLLREKATKRRGKTWGVGSELQLNEQTGLTSEIFSQQRGRPLFQIGVRHWIVTDRVQLDASYGARLGGGSAERFLSVGLVLFSDAIL